MAVIRGPKEAEDKVRVRSIAYNTDKAPEDGYAVDAGDIPSFPEPQPGIRYKRYYNPKEDEFWIEEEEREYDLEDEVKELREVVADLFELLEEKEVI